MSKDLTLNELLDEILTARGHTNPHKRKRLITNIRHSFFGTDTSPEGSRRKRGHFSMEMAIEIVRWYLDSAVWFENLPTEPKINAFSEARKSAGIASGFIRVHRKVKGDVGLVVRLEQLAEYIFDKENAPYQFPQANEFIFAISFGEIDWQGKNREKIGGLCKMVLDVIEASLTQKEYV